MRRTPAVLAGRWPAKLIVFAALVLILRGFLGRIVHPVAAALGTGDAPIGVLAVEVVLLAAYTLGLFAFPDRFWRRAFKFLCLMTGYMLLGPVLAAGLAGAGIGGSLALEAVNRIAGHALALVVGYVAYKLAWPRLEPYKPRFNPAV